MSSKFEIKDNTGVLFDNSTKKTNEKQPDFKGIVNIDGKRYQIAAWENITSQKKIKVFNLVFSEEKPSYTEQRDAYVESMIDNDSNHAFHKKSDTNTDKQVNEQKNNIDSDIVNNSNPFDINNDNDNNNMNDPFGLNDNNDNIFNDSVSDTSIVDELSNYL
jgi:putative uncharacterized protein DDB_G0287265